MASAMFSILVTKENHLALTKNHLNYAEFVVSCFMSWETIRMHWQTCKPPIVPHAIMRTHSGMEPSLIDFQNDLTDSPKLHTDGCPFIFWVCHRILAKIKYLLNDYKGALADLNRADQAEPDNHVTLRSKLNSYHHLCTTQTWGQLYRLDLFLKQINV